MAVFEYRGRVYWSETDAAGIAHFTSILRYCERAEEELFISRIGGYRRGAIVFPRVHVECDYEGPLYPHDEYRVVIEEARVGGKSIRWRFRVENLTRGYVAARGAFVTVAFDPVAGRSVEVPEVIRRALSGSTEEGAG